MASVPNLNPEHAARVRKGLLTAGSVIPISGGAKGQWLELRARDRQLMWGLSPYFLFLQERHTSTMPTKKTAMKFDRDQTIG
jgi:hypothetical protein